MKESEDVNRQFRWDFKECEIKVTKVKIFIGEILENNIKLMRWGCRKGLSRRYVISLFTLQQWSCRKGTLSGSNIFSAEQKEKETRSQIRD